MIGRRRNGCAPRSDKCTCNSNPVCGVIALPQLTAIIQNQAIERAASPLLTSVLQSHVQWPSQAPSCASQDVRLVSPLHCELKARNIAHYQATRLSSAV